MAHLPNTQLPTVRPSEDGKWLRCPKCSKAYWGAFRPTDFVLDKLNTHLEKAHKADAEAGADAPAAAVLRHATANTPCGVPGCLGCPVAIVPARKPKPAPRARNARKIAKIAEVAQKRGDGPVRIVREAGPRTPELLDIDIAQEIAQALAPHLHGAQGPRNFSDEGNNRFAPERVAKDANKGQDVVARVQAALSPVKWPDGRVAV